MQLPVSMQRAMAKQAEAEREKRAKVLLAQGELLAAQTLADAAQLLSTEPISLQLRYLQTITEVATEKSSTLIFPLPLDLVVPLATLLRRFAGGGGLASAAPPNAPAIVPADIVAPLAQAARQTFHTGES